MLLQSGPSKDEATMGSIYVDGTWECHTLEDAVREIPGVPVEEWKVHGKTAIPAGRYRVLPEDSPKFGPNTLTLQNVPGYKYIRIHPVSTAADTEGCIGVGDTLDWDKERISGGSVRGVNERLKQKVLSAIAFGEEVWITVRRTV